MSAAHKLPGIGKVLVPPIASAAEVHAKRDAMGMSQAELAAEMGVTEFSVWRWENNKRDITVAHTTLLRMIFDERERAGRLKS